MTSKQIDPTQLPPKFLKPPLVDFGRLFYPSWKEENGDYGFFSTDKTAIPHGTTLLLSGAPGAGKTLFALSFIRSLYVGQLRTWGAETTDGGLDQESKKIQWAKIPILYYVSLEIFPQKLKQAVKPFGWLDDEEDWIFREKEGRRGIFERPTVRIITATPEVDRPVPGAEELLSSIFAQIARAQAREEENRPVLVIIDSLTALIRTRNDYSERRRQTHETIYRLQKLFRPGQLLFTILIAERESGHAEGSDTGSMVEEYLADMVFRLSTRILPLGRRLRTLEIPKTQGMAITIGEHTWMIVTDQTIESYLDEDYLKARVRKGAGMPATIAEGANWPPFGTITIHPRPRGFSRGTKTNP